MFNKKGRAILVISIVLVFLILVSAISYFVFIKNGAGSSKALPIDVCVYDSKKYITCGTAFVLVSQGVEYPLVANEKFYFPQGENQLIGLVDPLRAAELEGKNSTEILMDKNKWGSYLLFLEEGEHTINEETSRRAVGSFIAQN